MPLIYLLRPSQENLLFKVDPTRQNMQKLILRIAGHLVHLVAEFEDKAVVAIELNPFVSFGIQVLPRPVEVLDRLYETDLSAKLRLSRGIRLIALREAKGVLTLIRSLLRTILHLINNITGL